MLRFRGMRTETDSQQEQIEEEKEEKDLKEIEKHREIIESCLDKSTLPEDYYFSALAELVLK